MATRARKIAPGPAESRTSGQVASGATASSRPATPSQTLHAGKKRAVNLADAAFREAEKDIPDLDAAIAFLRQFTLIPEGVNAVSEAGLVSGLLHFAHSAPTHELARKGLISFAYIARELLEARRFEAVATAVAERAEEQLTLRLDEHTTRLETRVEELLTEVSEAKNELRGCGQKLREACDWVGQAEAALTVARKDLETATTTTPGSGAPSSSFPPLTFDTAPARTRRAVTLAEHLQRQVLIRGATLAIPDGQEDAAAVARQQAVEAIKALEKEGLTPPAGGDVEAARVLQHGDIVFTASSAEMARWLSRPAVARAFSRHLGLRAQIIERTYRLVAERVPVTFDPASHTALREIEAQNGLQAGAITRADWIKPLSRRRPGQLTAHLMLTVSDVNQANRALRGLRLGERRIMVRRDMEEPKRCARCQSYDGHFARDCKAEGDVCATCAGAHPTSECSVRDPRLYRCANCQEDGHAAWDHSCPTLRSKVRARIARRADAGFRFFVTNSPETWIPDDEELARAPPPPTVWSQIKGAFDRADSAHASGTQKTINSYFTQASQPPARTQ
ncbi:hypothetical protein ACG7TL_003324 [Trametes sanguinea]